MIVAEGDLVWPLTADTAAQLAALTDITMDQITQATNLAVEWLWTLTARQFGTRVVSDRPQTYLPRTQFRDIPSFLQSVFGYSRGWPYDADPRTGQQSIRQILELERDAISVAAINGWPAPGITDPAWDPTTGLLNVAVYRLEGNYLIRQDGGIWPQTQNMIAELGRPDTWAISYQRGVIPPVQGQRAAGLLAIQFANALLGSKECKLPYNVQTVTRSGVSITRAVLNAFKTTGIGEVDQWVAAVNPGTLASPPAIWSPDIPRNTGPYLGSYAGGSATVLP